jgi:hypothetical protein
MTQTIKRWVEWLLSVLFGFDLEWQVVDTLSIDPIPLRETDYRKPFHCSSNITGLYEQRPKPPWWGHSHRHETERRRERAARQIKRRVASR